MEYNKSLLESWTGDFEKSDLEEDSDEESWNSMWEGIIENHRINKRIEYCKSLLAENKDAFLCYVLARLYSFWESGHCTQVMHMRPVRYYCIMAIRIDRDYARAWALISAVYWRLSLMERAKKHLFEGDGDFVEEAVLFQSATKNNGSRLLFDVCENRRKQIKYIEKAIYCIKRALQKESLNEKYQEFLKCYFQERNEIYK
jgi:hypothetical protein